MIKIQNNTASREPLPHFLVGLNAESLADMSWTDPALGVSDCSWWPEEDVSTALSAFEKYSGNESFEIDFENKVVKVKKEIVKMTPVEKEQEYKRLTSEIVSATQSRLDNWAKTRNYDGILSLCTYATSTVTKFSAEGQAGVNARDATWAKMYQILDEINQGLRPVPSSYQDIESELPVLTWD